MRSLLFVWALFTFCIGGEGAPINSRRVPLAIDRSQVSRAVETTTTSYGDEKAALKVEVESVSDEKSQLKIEVESVHDEDCETESAAYYDWEKKHEPATTTARPPGLRVGKRSEARHAKRYREEQVRALIDTTPRRSSWRDGWRDLMGKKDPAPQSTTVPPVPWGKVVDQQLKENSRIERLPPNQQPAAQEKARKRRETYLAERMRQERGCSLEDSDA